MWIYDLDMRYYHLKVDVSCTVVCRAYKLDFFFYLFWSAGEIEKSWRSKVIKSLDPHPCQRYASAWLFILCAFSIN